MPSNHSLRTRSYKVGRGLAPRISNRFRMIHQPLIATHSLSCCISTSRTKRGSVATRFEGPESRTRGQSPAQITRSGRYSSEPVTVASHPSNSRYRLVYGRFRGRARAQSPAQPSLHVRHDRRNVADGTLRDSGVFRPAEQDQCELPLLACAILLGKPSASYHSCPFTQGMRP